METIIPSQAGYAHVNGLAMYYEIHGAGQPLILLHGGLGLTSMFGDVLPLLAEDRQVIAVDLQAHGRTADINRPHALRVDGRRHRRADRASWPGKNRPHGLLPGRWRCPAMCYPASGAGAQACGRLNSLQPERMVPGGCREHGSNEWSRGRVHEGIAHGTRNMPGLRHGPRIFRCYCDKIGDMLRHSYDWSDDVAALKTPTMLVFGDADSIPPAYAARFFELLGGGKTDAGWDGSGMSSARLAILPGTTHYNIFSLPQCWCRSSDHFSTHLAGNANVGANKASWSRTICRT